MKKKLSMDEIGEGGVMGEGLRYLSEVGLWIPRMVWDVSIYTLFLFLVAVT